MSRQIKFRAWDKSREVMHHDFQFIKSGEEGNDWIIFTSDKQTLKDVQHPLENPYFQQQFKIEQFTERIDVNRVEIYEGDILKSAGIVAWNNIELCWSCIDIEWNDKREWHNMEYLTTPLEVIGNIHQNKDLLT